MTEIVLFLHFIVAFMIVALILLQQGKGASMGAAFGSGASATIFGSRGPSSFLMKLTGVVVAAFFVTSLSLDCLTTKQVRLENTLSLPASSLSLTHSIPFLAGNHVVKEGS